MSSNKVRTHLRFSKPFRYLLIIVVVLLPLASAVAQPRNDQYLRISFIDVGQGDAVWIQTPATDGSPSRNILIDGGPDRKAKNRVLAYLSAYGLKPGSIIDCIVATHPHTDHYPGLLDVLEQYEVRTIVDSGLPKEGPQFAVFRDAAKVEKIQGKKSAFIELRTNPQVTLDWGSVKTEILYAEQNLPSLGRENTRENNASTVIKVTYGGFSFLFMGDAEGKERKDDPKTAHYVEEFLLNKYRNDPDKLRATVLKAGHHGSETGSTQPFLDAVHPKVVVVMSGRKSFSGTFLPDSSGLARYDSVGATIVRTDYKDAEERRDTVNDADGDDIYMYSDGETLRIYQARGTQGKRKWTRVKTLQSEE